MERPRLKALALDATLAELITRLHQAVLLPRLACRRTRVCRGIELNLNLRKYTVTTPFLMLPGVTRPRGSSAASS